MALICVLLELNVNFFLWFMEELKFCLGCFMVEDREKKLKNIVWKDYDKINASHLSNGQNLLSHTKPHLSPHL